MEIPVLVRLEQVWGDRFFQKQEWGPINYLIGPNGSGKTLFLQELLQQLQENGISFRYLSRTIYSIPHMTGYLTMVIWLYPTTNAGSPLEFYNNYWLQKHRRINPIS